MQFSQPPEMSIDTSKSYAAFMETDAGQIKIELDAKKAPQTVNNFVFLAEQGYYDNSIFHRVIPGFMMQGGDPSGTGYGGPGYNIPDEFPGPGEYKHGSIAMANTGRPNTGGSQFFIVGGPAGESLPPQYTLFGQVVEGIDVVDQIVTDGSSAGVPPTVTHSLVKLRIEVGD